MPVPFFRCAKCRKEFGTCSEAEACELGHLEVISACSKQYTIGKYPYIIMVTFTDGSTKEYFADPHY